MPKNQIIKPNLLQLALEEKKRKTAPDFIHENRSHINKFSKGLSKDRFVVKKRIKR